MEQIIELAIAKLEEELKETPQAEVFAVYLKNKCQTDLTLAENINKTDKTLSGLINHIQTEAKKRASHSFAMVDSDTVFKWAENYYGKEKPEINKSDVDAASDAIAKGASTSITDKPHVRKPKEKKKDENTDTGQISLLDLLL
jgi:citrate synthase